MVHGDDWKFGNDKNNNLTYEIKFYIAACRNAFHSLIKSNIATYLDSVTKIQEKFLP